MRHAWNLRSLASPRFARAAAKPFGFWPGSYQGPKSWSFGSKFWPKPSVLARKIPNGIFLIFRFFLRKNRGKMRPEGRSGAPSWILRSALASRGLAQNPSDSWADLTNLVKWGRVLVQPSVWTKSKILGRLRHASLCWYFWPGLGKLGQIRPPIPLPPVLTSMDTSLEPGVAGLEGPGQS